ncbi:protein FAM151B-like [Daphnia carinata]|uniref:protein FAM151B-like n=1 Tax=Daphnia carinata TaxID=120202 RepID=UPI0025797DF9|nr:protein FAM151B-like [Daphnia carinata]
MPHRLVMTMFTFWIVVRTSAFSVQNLENTSDLTIDRMETVVHAANRAFPSVVDIYPEIGTDLTQVTWAHGVDTRKKLERALRGSVMMIEADVSLGKLKGDPHSPNRPIMAHPPVTASDLTLETFLDMVLDESQYKGIKLDFKSNDVLERALQIIKSRENRIRVPLWLNADIIQGPVNAMSEPLNADMFLSLTKSYFPTAVISVGWTTKVGKDGSYTFDHVRKMRDVLTANQITAPVTFPVRAALATTLESRENILWLLNQIPGSTITIWNSFGDEVDVPALLDFINTIGKEFIYIDVQRGLRCQISRYRAFRSASSWLLNTLAIARTGKFSAGAGFLALITYVTCMTSFFPWNADSYTSQ